MNIHQKDEPILESRVLTINGEYIRHQYLSEGDRVEWYKNIAGTRVPCLNLNELEVAYQKALRERKEELL